MEMEPNFGKRQSMLKWLFEKGYLIPMNVENPWNVKVTQFRLNWATVKEKLEVDPPPQLRPLSPEDIRNGNSHMPQVR